MGGKVRGWCGVGGCGKGEMGWRVQRTSNTLLDAGLKQLGTLAKTCK